MYPVRVRGPRGGEDGEGEANGSPGRGGRRRVPRGRVPGGVDGADRPPRRGDQGRALPPLSRQGRAVPVRQPGARRAHRSAALRRPARAQPERGAGSLHRADPRVLGEAAPANGVLSADDDQAGPAAPGPAGLRARLPRDAGGAHPAVPSGARGRRAERAHRRRERAGAGGGARRRAGDDAGRPQANSVDAGREPARALRGALPGSTQVAGSKGGRAWTSARRR